MMTGMTLNCKPGEERIDAFVNRPLASLIVGAAIKTPITANGLTLIGMVIGASAGLCFALASTGQRYMPLAVGAVLLFVSMVFDCADGQLARARGGGSRSGRILDGVADYVVGISVHVGLALALIKVFGMPVAPAWFLTGAAMVSTAIQCFLLDHYKNRGTAGETADELCAARAALAAARAGHGGRLTDRILLPIYIGYTRLQRVFTSAVGPQREGAGTEKPASDPLLCRLSYIGPSSHNVLISIAAVSGLIAPYFLLVIVAGNLYLAWAVIFSCSARKNGAGEQVNS